MIADNATPDMCCMVCDLVAMARSVFLNTIHGSHVLECNSFFSTLPIAHSKLDLAFNVVVVGVLATNATIGSNSC